MMAIFNGAHQERMISGHSLLRTWITKFQVITKRLKSDDQNKMSGKLPL